MNNYWKNRFIELEKSSYKKGYQAYKNIEESLIKAQREIEKQIDLSDISPYSSNDLNIIILYEKIKNSKIFSNVNCPVISNNYTNRSVQYNNKTYYLNNTSFEYDIDAEDRNNRKVYFVVKLSTDGFHLTSKEINFVQKLKY